MTHQNKLPKSQETAVMIQKRSFALTLIKLEGDINYNLETGLSNLKVV